MTIHCTAACQEHELHCALQSLARLQREAGRLGAVNARREKYKQLGSAYCMEIEDHAIAIHPLGGGTPEGSAFVLGTMRRVSHIKFYRQACRAGSHDKDVVRESIRYDGSLTAQNWKHSAPITPAAETERGPIL